MSDLDSRIAALEEELIILKSSKYMSALTDDDAINILKSAIDKFKDVKSNSFIVSLVKISPKKMSNKQLAWLHIMAVKYKARLDKKQEYRKKYTFKDVELCASMNGYFVRKHYNPDKNILEIIVCTDGTFTDYVDFRTTTEAVQFMTNWNLDGNNSIFVKG